MNFIKNIFLSKHVLKDSLDILRNQNSLNFEVFNDFEKDEQITPNITRYHTILASYFASKPLYLDESTQKKPNIRKLVEQPWQQIIAELWDGVAETFTDLHFVQCKCLAGMTDFLLDDYKKVVSRRLEETNLIVSTFQRFIQDNASQLRSNSNLCFQLAMLEPPVSSVGKKTRQITTISSIPCFEPIHSNSSDNVSPEIRFNEHKGPIQALAFDTKNGLLISSDGEEVIRWDIESSAIVSRYTLPGQKDVAGTAFAGIGRWKINFAEQSNSIILGNVLYDGTTGLEINCFISTRVTEGEWTAQPAISSDSSLIAFSTKKASQPNIYGSDHCLTLLSSNSGKVLAELPHTGIVNFVIISPNLKLVVTLQHSPSYDQGEKASYQAILRVWEIARKREIYRYDEDNFDTAAFSFDSTLLFAQSRSTIYGWSTSDWSQLFSIEDFSETKFGILSLDTSSAITWGSNSVTLWDIHTQKIAGRIIFTNDRGGIFSLVLSDDSKNFAVGYGDGLIELWSIETLRKSRPNEELRQTEDTVKEARFLAFSPNGKRIVISYFRYLISVVDVDNNSEIISRDFVSNENDLFHTHQTEKCYYTPDGASIILVGISSRPDTSSERTAYGHKIIYSGSVRRVSATDLTDQAVFVFGDQQFINESCITPYGIFVSISRNVFQLSLDDLVLIKEYGWASAWALTENGNYLALGTQQGLMMWNFSNDTKVELLVGDPAMQPQFSPDGTLIVASSFCTRNYRSEILKVFSVRQGGEIFYIRQELNSGYYAWQCPDYWKFSNDGKRLLLIKDESKSIYDLNTGQSCMLEKSGPKYLDMKYFSNFKILYKFSADDRFVSEIEQNAVRIWDSNSGRLLANLPLEKIQAADWNPTASVLGVFHASRLELFNLLNIDQNPPIVTAMKVFDFQTKTISSDYTTVCIHCANRLQVPAVIITTIFEISSNAGVTDLDSPCLKLPHEAWEEPGLFSNCPKCGGELKFNPFIAVGEY